MILSFPVPRILQTVIYVLVGQTRCSTFRHLGAWFVLSSFVTALNSIWFDVLRSMVSSVVTEVSVSVSAFSYFS